MKTKQQKQVELEKNLTDLKSSQTVIFTDYTGVATKDLESFKKDLYKENAKFRVTRKRLLRVALEKSEIAVNPEDFEGQLGVVWSPKESVETAGMVYKFAKTNDKFKVLAGYDLAAGEVLGIDYLTKLSTLPSREVLLGQLVGMIAAPIKMTMLVLKERAKKLESVG